MTTTVWSDALGCKITMVALEFTGPGANTSLIGGWELARKSTDCREPEPRGPAPVPVVQPTQPTEGSCACGVRFNYMDRRFGACKKCRAIARNARQARKKVAMRAAARATGPCVICLARDTRPGGATCERCIEKAIHNCRKRRQQQKEAA